ncbi:MAG TPA: ABC transporter substrate-binding protein [Candidatus Bathyarchaeia archaeon]|nr:ABC transporter substrate-binding protein [Candidatus Bathyarchaeia archaeon]
MKKIAVFLLSLSMILSLLVACSSEPSNGSGSNSGESSNTETQQANGQKVVLNFWTLFEGGDGEFMQQMIDQFNQEHPDIQVKNTKLAWAEYYTKLITAVSSGNGPDIGVSHTSKLPDLVNQGVVTELDESAREAGLDWSSFNQNILNATIYDSKHYAIPIDTHPFILYYNKKLLREAGALGDDGRPKFDPTPEGFVKFLVDLKGKLPANVMPFAMANKEHDPFRMWWSFYHQMGGKDIISDDLKSPAIDMDKAVKAANYIKDLYHKEQVIKLNDPDFYKTFQSGQAAIMMTGVWATGTWEKTENFEFGAMPIPALFGKPATWGDSHTLVLPTQSSEDPEKRKAAVTFANWIAENGQIWAQAGHIPSKPSAIEKEEFKKLPYRSDYVIVADSVAFNKPSDKNWAIRDNVVFKNLDKVWNNTMSAEDAFKATHDQLGQLLQQ